MTRESVQFDDLTAYLLSQGWKPDAPGPAGSLWKRPDIEFPVAIPTGLSSDKYEWTEVVNRIAVANRTSAPQIEVAIQRLYVDVHKFRASDPDLIRESIPLDAGFNLFATARNLIRSAASTSRSLKSQIGNNYGKTALALAGKSRFGHTVQGSYVVPLLMPLERPQAPVSDTPFVFEESGVLHPLIEPQERLVTRTLAQALTAIQKGVVEPAVHPRASIVTPLVAAGVSREMVSAVAQIVESDGVATFDVAFEWAAAFEKPAGDLHVVSFPSDSAPLLRSAAEFLRAEKRHQGESLSGRIIDLGDEEETGFRRVIIRTYRRGRQTRVNVFLDPETTYRAHGWFEQHRDVSVTGVVKTAPGQSPWIESPTQFAPLDEVVLFSDGPVDDHQK